MKKILTILLFCLMALPAAVFAQDETVCLDWETTLALSGAEELVSKGDFITLEDPAVKVWIPVYLTIVELPEDLVENGSIQFFADEQFDHSVTVIYMESGKETPGSWKEKLASMDDVSNITDIIINGVPAISYDLEENDMSCVTFISDSGSILELSFSPMSEESFFAETRLILSSVQKIDQES